MFDIITNNFCGLESVRRADARNYVDFTCFFLPCVTQEANENPQLV